MGHAHRVLFLPGASGAGDYWRPVTKHLPESWKKTLLSWPGSGDEPHEPRVRGFADLVDLAAAELADGSDLVAQSMGGAVALGLALAHPGQVRRLVLVATSGGIDLAGHGATDWRAEYRAEFPRAAPWVRQERPDFGSELAKVRAPTLLVWGGADPISPVSVGRRLAALLPASELHVIPGAGHSLARDHPELVAGLIFDHLA